MIDADARAKLQAARREASEAMNPVVPASNEAGLIDGRYRPLRQMTQC